MSFDSALWWNGGAFVYLGRMGDNKGVEHVLAAWCALKREFYDRCPDLWLVGGAPVEIDSIRRKISDPAELLAHEASGRVRWWGYLNQEGISALFLKACALIMHSSYEPGGRVILEAMAQGLPVVATPHGFALDLVDDWQTGFIVSYGDVETLRHRMEHFARAPLLGVSLGIAARATACKALDDWDFFRTHKDTYLLALSGAEAPPIDAPHSSPAVIQNSMPRGLMGRYPFPVAVPDTADVLVIASKALNAPANECLIEQRVSDGHSLVWYVRGGNTTVVVKHAYTTYIRRPLWDRTYDGPLIRPGKIRRKYELSASRLPGFAPIILSDELLGVHVLPYLSVLTGKLPLELARAALVPLSRLWQTPITEDAKYLVHIADKWWRNRQDLPWRHNGALAAELRCTSLRIAWAEIRDKVAAQDLRIPTDMAHQLEAISSMCEEIAELEADAVHLCHQHGDYSSTHLRTDGKDAYLLDGELCTVGWWGRDAAFLLMRSDNSMSDDWWDEALTLISSTQEKRRLVLLWVIVEAVNETARIGTLFPGKHPNYAQLWWKAAISRL